MTSLVTQEPCLSQAGVLVGPGASDRESEELDDANVGGSEESASSWVELEAGNIGSAPIVSECVDRRLPLRQICVILIQYIAEVVEFHKAAGKTHNQSLLVW